MIIPSIDIMGGSTVQLVGGREKKLDAGDPRPIAQRFAPVGEIAVIDLDAALSKGSNEALVRNLLSIARCRVGGGIRDESSAVGWLDAGAAKVILGTAAKPEILRNLPRERVIAALDARHNDVVVEGWTKATGATVEDRIDELREHVGGFLVTFVEREGRMTGLEIERVRELIRRATPARLTVAGGVRTPKDVADADHAGADAQVGMALYSGAFDLAGGFTAPLRTDRADGLWPTIVADERGVALGLVYSSLESVRESLRTRSGVYFSRSRGGLWAKGETSGNTQELLRIDADCDRDALLFTVRQRGGGFCHTGSATCFGSLTGLAALERSIDPHAAASRPGSYTARLLSDAALLRSKLLEEAAELIESSDADHAAAEAADLLYFALVAATARGARLADIDRHLGRRAMRVTRRPGNAKPSASGDAQ